MNRYCGSSGGTSGYSVLDTSSQDLFLDLLVFQLAGVNVFCEKNIIKFPQNITNDRLTGAA